MNNYFDYVGQTDFIKNIKHTLSLNKKILLNNIKQDSDFLYYTFINSNFENRLIICNDDRHLRHIAKLCDFYKLKYLYLNSTDFLFEYANLNKNINENNRINTFYQLLNEKDSFILLTVDNLITPIVSPKYIQDNTIKLNVSDNIDFNTLTLNLLNNGYERVHRVDRSGQFCIRGEIIDVFSPGYDFPVRIDFFDTEIEKIKSFDIFTQLTIDNDLNEYIIYPNILTVENNNTNLLNYFDEKNTIIFMPKFVDSLNNAKDLIEEYNNSSLKDNQVQIYQEDQIIKYLDNYPLYISSVFDDDAKYFSKISKVEDKAKSIIVNNENRYNGFINLIKEYKDKKYKTFIISSTNTRINNLKDTLENEDIYSTFSNSDIKNGEVSLLLGNVNFSFVIDDFKLCILSENDIFNINLKKHIKQKKNNKNILQVSDISIGDYLIHENYGIGRYIGINSLENKGKSYDYVTLEYKDNAKLYIAATDLDKLTKYHKDDSSIIRLDSLTSNKWATSKSSAKKHIEEIAKDLVLLYAKRQDKKGYKFSKDTIWQKEFEDNFIYEETLGQLNAISDVKKDMEDDKIMDRLICGDVGYGKTEIALRAAFKAVQDSKQVIYLTPTTILCSQHYKTFKERFEKYPVKIMQLSRLNSKKEISSTVKAIKDGSADIIIGTHRLLSNDVVFNDLGLLIIDEEQRFGVRHKDKLKKIKENVDVLTLSATPLPRTLHMSLIGIRDISILDEPPQDRQSVATYVMKYNIDVIKDAINRELSRNGQVFYVYNNIEHINSIVAKLKNLFPNANIDYVHGKMNKEVLENKMMDFVNKNTDILVTTTIIETGLDIANANTLIIENANHFGLTTLYQLRGRVGRSEKKAYAFFLISDENKISEESEKRLSAIKKFDELGSGLNIALADLNIRGAGNILGTQQSGHMSRIGYDLYCKMLSNAIKRNKNNEDDKLDEFTTSINISLDANIEDSYEDDPKRKLEIYKDISNVTNIDEKEALIYELENKYGYVTNKIKLLMDVSIYREKAHKLYITQILESKFNIRFEFYKDAILNPSVITKLIEEYDNKLFVLNNSGVTAIEYALDDADTSSFEIVKNLLNNLEKLNEK